MIGVDMIGAVKSKTTKGNNEVMDLAIIDSTRGWVKVKDMMLSQNMLS
jgi:hypothetical protein